MWSLVSLSGIGLLWAAEHNKLQMCTIDPTCGNSQRWWGLTLTVLISGTIVSCIDLLNLGSGSGICFFFFLIHKAFTLAGYLKTVKEIMTFEKLRVFYINEYNDYYLKF